MRPAGSNWLKATLHMMGIEPNPAQAEIFRWWIETESRVAGILGGERSGKSLMASLMAVSGMGIDTTQPIKGERIYWIVGPDYNQARPEFTYIYEAFKNAGLVDGDPSMPANPASPWSFKSIFGHVVQTRSSAEVAKLASFSVYGIVMAEAAQQAQEVYLKCLGRTSESRGFLILVGTLERGLPWYQDLFARWQAPNPLGARFFSLPTWTNTHSYPGGREDPEILRLESEYPEDLFMERFGAEPRRYHNVVVPEFDMARHVRHIARDPNVPVELWIDPGQVCYAVLFTQTVGKSVRILDRVYTHSQIVHDVIPIVQGNRLFQFVNPRDAGVIDIAGTQQHGNKSQTTLWQELAGCSFRFQKHDLEDTIASLRFRLKGVDQYGVPLMLFNDHFTNLKSPQGEALDVLAEFELWQWPERAFGRNEPRQPIDKNNHALKAIGYGLLDHFGKSGIDQRRRRPQAKRKKDKLNYWLPVERKSQNPYERWRKNR